MAAAATHVVPDDNFDDQVVRAYIGQEFGHYSPEKPPNGSRRRSRKSERPNSSSTSRTENEPNAFCKKLGRQIVSAMIRRNRPMPCYTFMASTCSRVHASS